MTISALKQRSASDLAAASRTCNARIREETKKFEEIMGDINKAPPIHGWKQLIVSQLQNKT